MMKFRKKTTATLFAAILIAMMGVMPALALDGSLGLSATVEEKIAVSIEIDVEDLAFGTMYVGESDSKSFTVTAHGTDLAYVTSELTSAEHEAFWLANLAITVPSGYAIGTTVIEKPYETETLATAFTAVLDAGSESGSYAGTLVFSISTIAP